MTTELVKIDPKEFGLDESNVVTIEQAFTPKIIERDALLELYAPFLTAEITPELCKQAKELRLKFVKNRTGIADIQSKFESFKKWAKSEIEKL